MHGAGQEVGRRERAMGHVCSFVLINLLLMLIPRGRERGRDRKEEAERWGGGGERERAIHQSVL